MRNLLLAPALLLTIIQSETAEAARRTCAVEHLEISGVIESVVASVRDPVMFSFGPDPSHTVVITPVTSSSEPRRIAISSTVRLAIHSPSQTFMKDGDALIGQPYHFEIVTDERCHRTLTVFPMTDHAVREKK